MAHENGDEIYFQVHHVYYDSGGIATGYSETGCMVGGENIDEINWEIWQIEKCLKRPVIWAGERFPEIYES